MPTLHERLGIAFPIFQAPMAGSQASRLAIAVAQAGGLGALPCGTLDANEITAEVAAIRAGTDGPFLLNFLCHAPPRVDEAREAALRAKLEPYLHELGATPNGRAPALAREPFGERHVERVEALRPAAVSFHFGLPAPELLDRVRATGAFVLSTATTADEARFLEDHGIDAIIAQGLEAGGHRGQFLRDDLEGQLPLRPLLEAIREVTSVPLVAAGGIATAIDVARAVQHGAKAVQVGTAFLFTDEAATTRLHRAALEDAAARETEITNVFSGRPARGFVNRLVRELGPIAPGLPDFPLVTALVAPLRASAEATGSDDFSPLWSGTGSVRGHPGPAGELVRELAVGFRH